MLVACCGCFDRLGHGLRIIVMGMCLCVPDLWKQKGVVVKPVLNLHRHSARYNPLLCVPHTKKGEICYG